MGCYVPITVSKPGASDRSTISVPCGRCPGCRAARANSWAFRLAEEEKCHALSRFVTLTYSDDNVIGSEFGLLTLQKRDLQLFFKRLRKLTNGRKIKYYACGEYGSRTARPHYHVILFGATDSEVERAWCRDGKPIGQCNFGEANAKTMRYVTKYICKPRMAGMLEDDDRQPEFSLMSKGLGASYITPEVRKFHNNALARYVVLPGGIKQAMPRYYAERIFSQVLREIMSEKTQVDLDKAYKRLCSEAGGEAEYLRSRNAGIKVAFEKFYNQRYANRDKL